MQLVESIVKSRVKKVRTFIMLGEMFSSLFVTC